MHNIDIVIDKECYYGQTAYQKRKKRELNSYSKTAMVKEVILMVIKTKAKEDVTHPL